MNNWYCGRAKKDITPPDDMIPNLWGLMDVPYAGVIDCLSLRVIALSAGDMKSLIISFDLDKAPCPKEWIPELAERTGIPQERILYIGTHTHSAPLTTIRQFEMPSHATDVQQQIMRQYEAMVHERLLEAVDAALAEMVPARMGTAVGRSFINTQRNLSLVYTAPDGTEYPYATQAPDYAAEIDHDLFAMKIESEDGAPLAFFVNYPVHCCVMFCNQFDEAGRMGISGDIAGNTSTCLEDRFPGSVAIWSSGAAGDINPVVMGAAMYPNPKDGSYVMERIGDWQSSQRLLKMQVGLHFNDILNTLKNVTCSSEGGEITGAIEWSETPGDNAGQDPEYGVYRLRIQGLRLGDTVLFGFGGELYNYYGMRIKNIFPEGKTVIINHDASLIYDAGYVFDDASIKKVAPKAPIFAMVPGGEPHMQSGYLEESLQTHTKSIYGRLFG